MMALQQGQYDMLTGATIHFVTFVSIPNNWCLREKHHLQRPLSPLSNNTLCGFRWTAKTILALFSICTGFFFLFFKCLEKAEIKITVIWIIQFPRSSHQQMRHSAKLVELRRSASFPCSERPFRSGGSFWDQKNDFTLGKKKKLNSWKCLNNLKYFTVPSWMVNILNISTTSKLIW